MIRKIADTGHYITLGLSRSRVQRLTKTAAVLWWGPDLDAADGTWYAITAGAPK